MPLLRALSCVLLLCGLAACASRPAETARQAADAPPPGPQEPAGGATAVEPEARSEAPGEEISMNGEPLSGPEEAPADQLPEPQADSWESGEIYSGPQATAKAPPGAVALPVPPSPAEPGKTAKAASGGKSAAAPAGKSATADKEAPAVKAAPAAKQAPAAKEGSAAREAPAAKATARTAPEAQAASEAVAEAGRGKARREVLARKGDTVVIDLEGRGWLLLPGDRQGVSFTGSETGAQRTTFSFKALEHGEYDLTFQLQDNTRGLSSSEAVRLRVLPEEKFRELLAATQETGPAPAAGLAGGQASPELGEGDAARLQKAERLFAAGFYDLALPEYLGVYREADPLLNDRLAAIYLGRGEGEAAAKFYGRNLSSPAPYSQKAIVGLVRAGLASGSAELVLEHLPALLALPAGDVAEELLGVARLAAGQGRQALALDLLNEYLRRYPRGDGLDRAYFQLAQLYELESPLRDVRLAREYYRKVYEDFPESEHANEARSRIQYLDRYFFHVQ
jgi:hypothetical protein